MVLACAASITSFAPLAQAQNGASSAQALFDEGRKLMNEGKYGQACPKLAASQRLDPGAGTLMNLGTCYEKNGQTASSWATFKDAASAARQSGRADWESAARARADELEAKLSRLAIVVPPEVDVEALVIERDGRPVDRGEWGVPLPVDPGVHPVEARAPGRQRWATTVTVAPNAATASVTVPPLVAEARAAEGQSTSATDTPLVEGDGSTQRLFGIGVAAAGVISVGIGAAFGMIAKSTHDDALARCTSDRRCDAGGISLGDKASSQAAISTVAFIAGGALVAGGAVVYFTAPKRRASAAGIFVAPSGFGGAAGVRGAW